MDDLPKQPKLTTHFNFPVEAIDHEAICKSLELLIERRTDLGGNVQTCLSHNFVRPRKRNIKTKIYLWVHYFIERFHLLKKTCLGG